MILEVTPGGFDQINPETNRLLCSYDYRNIEGFVDLSNYQGGFCILYGGFSRLVSSIFEKTFSKGVWDDGSVDEVLEDLRWIHREQFNNNNWEWQYICPSIGETDRLYVGS